MIEPEISYKKSGVTEKKNTKKEKNSLVLVSVNFGAFEIIHHLFRKLRKKIAII